MKRFSSIIKNIIAIFLLFYCISCKKYFERELFITGTEAYYDLRNSKFPKEKTDLINIRIVENNCVDTIFLNGGMVIPKAKFTLDNNISIMNTGDLYIYNPKGMRCKIKIKYFWYNP